MASVMRRPAVWPTKMTVTMIRAIVASVMPRPIKVETIILALCLTVTVSFSASKRAYFRLTSIPTSSVTRGIVITAMRTRSMSMILN